MKLSEAKILDERNILDAADLMRNPADRQQWFITLTLKSGQRFILADDNDIPIVDANLETLFDLLKSLRFSTAQITL